MHRNNVVVFRTGHLGDTICAIPAFRLLREHFSDSNLVLLCDRPDQGDKIAAAQVIRDLGIFDEIATYSSKRGLATIVELTRLIRGFHPAAAIILPQVREPSESLRKKIWLFRLCGVQDIRGSQLVGSDHELHPNETDRLLEILKMAGITGPKPHYAIRSNEESVFRLRAELTQIGCSKQKPLIVFCGGGKASTQRWPMERYAAVLRRTAESLPCAILAIGSEGELSEYREKILPVFPDLKFLDRSLAMLELFELFRFATAYVGNDTGPAHIAAAVGCPTAVVMSARNAPGMWDPDVEQRLIIRHRTECENCFLIDCVYEKHRCMREITVEQVTQQLLSFLTKLFRQKSLDITCAGSRESSAFH